LNDDVFILQFILHHLDLLNVRLCTAARPILDCFAVILLSLNDTLEGGWLHDDAAIHADVLLLSDGLRLLGPFFSAKWLLLTSRAVQRFAVGLITHSVVVLLTNGRDLLGLLVGGNALGGFDIVDLFVVFSRRDEGVASFLLGAGNILLSDGVASTTVIANGGGSRDWFGTLLDGSLFCGGGTLHFLLVS
jgi:hypothetical protein